MPIIRNVFRDRVRRRPQLVFGWFFAIAWVLACFNVSLCLADTPAPPGVDDFLKTNPSIADILKYRNALPEIADRIKVTEAGFANAKTYADFKALATAEGNASDDYRSALDGSTGTHAAQLVAFKPTLDQVLAISKAQNRIDSMIQLHQAALALVKTPSDYAQLTHAEVNSPSDDYTAALKKFAIDNLAAFVAVSPSIQDILALRKQDNSIEGISKINAGVVPAIKRAGDFVTLSKSEFDNPVAEYTTALGTFRDQHLADFFKLKPTIAQVLDLGRTDNDVASVIAIHEAALPLVRTPADFATLSKSEFGAASTEYTVALLKFMSDHIADFAKTHPSIKDILALRTQANDIDTIDKINQGVLGAIASPADFLTLVHSEFKGASNEYLAKLGGFADAHAADFLKLNPSVDQLVSYEGSMSSYDAKKAFVQKVLPLIKSRADAVRLTEIYPDNMTRDQIAADDQLKQSWLARFGPVHGGPADKTPAANPGYTWKQCERPDLQNATWPWGADNHFRVECAPDTLYSWQSYENVMKWAKGSTPQKVMPIDFLYLWRTPLGTYGYNQLSVRIKLKPGVRFVQIDDNNRHCPIDAAKDANSIYISYIPRVGQGYMEYLLCSSGPIESWSYGTPEHEKELKREKDWVSSHDPSQYDSMKRGENDQACFYGFSIPDEHNDWSIKRLLSDLDFMRDLVVSGSGRIFYAQGVPQDRARHFETKLPGYFNPNGYPDPAPAPAASAAAPAPKQ